jgi:drug/metabolite transporter (DMT)-like permease
LTATESVPIVLGLGAAVCWGAGDFLGGLASRKTDALGVVAFALLTGGLLAIGFAVVGREPIPPAANIAWAMGAGIFGGLALSAFYQALAIGKIGINAPVSGVLTAGIPAVAGMVMLGAPRAIQLAGFGLALVSIVLVAQGGARQEKNRGLGLALAAGVGFGGFILFLKFATETHVFGPLSASRVSSTIFILLICLAFRRSWFPRPGTWPLIVSAGVLDTAGTVMFAYAAQLGRMDVAAVLAAMYPGATVVLARIFLKEYLTRWQTVGVLTALAAIALIAI